METGLVLCTFWYYDSHIGRWLTRDPAGYAGGMNLYAYCYGNPTNALDPLGLDAEELKMVQATAWKTPEAAATAFVYAVWDMSFRQKEYSAGIVQVQGLLPDGTYGSKGWRVMDVHEGGPGSVQPGGGGAYDVHTHPWAEGDQQPRLDGRMGKSVNPFQASKPGNSYLGEGNGDTRAGKDNKHDMFIGTAVGVGLWRQTQDIDDGSLQFIAPSRSQYEKMLKQMKTLSGALTGNPFGGTSCQ